MYSTGSTSSCGVMKRAVYRYRYLMAASCSRKTLCSQQAYLFSVNAGKEVVQMPLQQSCGELRHISGLIDCTVGFIYTFPPTTDSQSRKRPKRGPCKRAAPHRLFSMHPIASHLNAIPSIWMPVSSVCFLHFQTQQRPKQGSRPRASPAVLSAIHPILGILPSLPRRLVPPSLGSEEATLNPRP